MTAVLARDLVQETCNRLKGAGVPAARLDAEILTAHSLGKDRYWLIANPDTVCSEESEKTAMALAERRMHGEPVAYCVGRKEFYSLDFIVDERVLIPRPETELLVDFAIYYAPRDGSLLDLCTGSGAIAIAVKHNRSDLAVTGTDISPDALTVAERNVAALLGKGGVDLREGDLFEPVNGETFDTIVSNPPYIDPAVRNTLQKEVLREPEIALFAGEGGTGTVRKIISESGGFLRDDGIVILEIGESMKAFVKEQGEKAGFAVSVMNDYAGLARVAVLKKK